MRKFATTILVCSTLLLSACVTAPVLLKQTSSGFPEGEFQNTDLDNAKTKIMEGCNNYQLSIIDTGSNHVTCGKDMAGSDAFLANMIIGGRGATNPQQRVKFTVFKVGNNTKVTARQWIESQSAFGQTRQHDLNDAKKRNDIQGFLTSIGAP